MEKSETFERREEKLEESRDGEVSVTDEVKKDASIGKNSNVSETKEIKTTETAEPTKETANLQRKTVKVCKIGLDHARHNMNNHDFAFTFLNIKVVTDGCGSGNHSEVGTRLFAQLFAREIAKNVKDGKITEKVFLETVNYVFEKMISLCSETKFIFDNFLFTILACLEFEDEFIVYHCGDGFIIKENTEGEITFEKLDCGKYPEYYAYNYVDPERLKKYNDGVTFKISHFCKSEYINIGVASDGLGYATGLFEVEMERLKEFLRKGKSVKIEMLINLNNQNERIFKDDISICF